MNERMMLRLQFYLSVGIASCGLFGVVYSNRVHDYGIVFYSAIFFLISGSILTIKDGMKFFRHLAKDECKHIESFNHNGKKYCISCGDEV